MEINKIYKESYTKCLTQLKKTHLEKVINFGKKFKSLLIISKFFKNSKIVDVVNYQLSSRVRLKLVHLKKE